MNMVTPMMLVLATASLAMAQGTGTQAGAGLKPPSSRVALGEVAPALEGYTRDSLFGDLWKRPGLSSRDRCLVTLAAMITRNQTGELPFYLDLALEDGVRPGEISGVITHLAFYAGWGNAMAATAAAREVFARHGIPADQLPPAGGHRLELEKGPEVERAAVTEKSIGPLFPGLVAYTNGLLFRDLWLRTDLAPRDRSLVTVSALIASGQVGPLGYHLNQAMDHGLTQTEAAEVVTHLAFYAGWPFAVSALPVMKEVFAKRPH